MVQRVFRIIKYKKLVVFFVLGFDVVVIITTLRAFMFGRTHGLLHKHMGWRYSHCDFYHVVSII